MFGKPYNNWAFKKSLLKTQYSDYIYQFSDWVLSFCHSQTVSWNNNDILGFNHAVDSVFNIPFGMLASDFHGFSSTSGRSTKTSQDNIGQRPIHSNTHDVAEDSSGRT